MTWTELDWPALDRLRDGFLKEKFEQGSYWQSTSALASYDLTFGERIGWKWDAVLSELANRGWKPCSRRIVDFGCGSGVASRRILETWPEFEELNLVDRSIDATRFAADRVIREHPKVRVRTTRPTTDADTLLVVSHVLNELNPADLATLRSLARTAGEILWVESGSHADSRLLVEEIREPLRATHRILAPCTHSETCGLLIPDNARHWCHTFAKPPSMIFQDASWSQFSRELQIDLRALPYSFIAMTTHPTVPNPPQLARVIGRPRKYKGYQKVLRCNATGVDEVRFQKRDSREMWTFLDDLPHGGIFSES